jgi:hypothetical protein
VPLFNLLCLLQRLALLDHQLVKPELWMKLAEMASKQQDPGKLMALVSEVNRLLEKQEDLLKDGAAKSAESEIARLMRLKESLLNKGSPESDTE